LIVNTAKILGTSGDITSCECCGKSNLKKTVVIEFDQDGIKHYGTSCAARALGLKGTYTAKDADKLIRDYSVKLERTARLQSAKESAQISANKFNEEFLVIPNGLNYSSVRSSAFRFGVHGSYVAVVAPQVAA